jgi:hypothetical protein
MSNLRLLIAVLVVVSGPVLAGTFEGGVNAYVRKDYATALRMWRPLATKGDAKAQSRLGAMYAKGLGVPKNDQQALVWCWVPCDHVPVRRKYRRKKSP